MVRSTPPRRPARPPARPAAAQATPLPGVLPRSDGGITGVFPGVGMAGGGTFSDVYLDLDTPIAIANGGTNARTAAAARTALSVPPINNAALTGTPTAPTPVNVETSTDQIATTAFVHGALNAAGMSVGPGGDILSVIAGTGLSGGGTSGNVTLNLTVPVLLEHGGTGQTTAEAAIAALGGLATAGGEITGIVTAPTADLGTNNQQLATTAFVQTAVLQAEIEHVFEWVHGDNLDLVPGPVIFTAAVPCTITGIKCEIVTNETSSSSVLEIFHNAQTLGVYLQLGAAHNAPGIYPILSPPDILELQTGDVIRARIGFSSHDGAGIVTITIKVPGGDAVTVSLDELAGVGGTDTGLLGRSAAGEWSLRSLSENEFITDDQGNVLTDDEGRPLIIPGGGTRIFPLADVEAEEGQALLMLSGLWTPGNVATDGGGGNGGGGGPAVWGQITGNIIDQLDLMSLIPPPPTTGDTINWSVGGDNTVSLLIYTNNTGDPVTLVSVIMTVQVQGAYGDMLLYHNGVEFGTRTSFASPGGTMFSGELELAPEDYISVWGSSTHGNGSITYAIAAPGAGGGGGPAVWGEITGTLAHQSDLNTALAGKQATLVSGTNLRTVNGNTLLGSTDLAIAGGGAALIEVADQAAAESASQSDPDNLYFWPNGELFGGTWGEITGTLANQIDLQAALDAKLPTTGGTLGTLTVTGATTLAGASSSGNITLTATPSADDHLTTKGYVDGLVETVTGGGAIVSWGGITGTISEQADLDAALGALQPTLVSSTNIKTVNGETLLGSGNVVITNIVTEHPERTWSNASPPSGANLFVATGPCTVTGIAIEITTPPSGENSEYAALAIIVGGTELVDPSGPHQRFAMDTSNANVLASLALEPIQLDTNETIYVYFHPYWEDPGEGRVVATIETDTVIPLWGNIKGTLSDQSDLKQVLDTKLEGVAWGDITGTITAQSDLFASTTLDAMTAASGIDAGYLERQTDGSWRVATSFEDETIAGEAWTLPNYGASDTVFTAPHRCTLLSITITVTTLSTNGECIIYAGETGSYSRQVGTWYMVGGTYAIFNGAHLLEAGEEIWFQGMNGSGEGTSSVTIRTAIPLYLSAAGGTVTGNITLDATPNAAGHLVPKSYVDDLVGQLSGSDGSGTVAWGLITGTLSEQDDLDTALAGKLSTSGGTLSGALGVTGNVSATGNLTAGGTIQGPNAVLGGITTATSEGPVYATAIAGNVVLSADAVASGNLTVGGDLAVGGAATFDTSLTVGSTVNAAGYLLDGEPFTGGAPAVHVGPTAPEDPESGWQWFDDDEMQLYVYTGSEWVIAVNIAAPQLIEVQDEAAALQESTNNPGNLYFWAD